MGWRIIVPVLCLIGILHVPGNAAQTNVAYRFTLTFSINDTFQSNYTDLNNNATQALITNITSQVQPLYKNKYPKNFLQFKISKFSNGSIVTVGELQFSNNDTKPNASDLAQVLINGSFSFAIIANSPNTTEVTQPAATAAPTTTAPAPAKVSQISLVFKILQTFKTNYANLSDPETKQLADNITTACSQVYRKRFSNFYRMLINSFSNGSIVTDSVLEFNTTNSASPNVTEVKDTLIAAIANGNFSLNVDNTSISTTDNATTTATPTTITTAAPTTTAPAPANVGKIGLVFKILQTFKTNYANLSDPETKQLADNITTACSQVYKKRFSNFYRMLIKSFSNGSIVTDSVLEFNTTNSASPNVAEVKNTLIAAIANGNFSFQVDNTSISITVIDSGLRDYKIAFKMNQTFTSDLSDISSDGATKLATNITSALDGFYKTFKDFSRTLVQQFRNGSIIVDGLLGFYNNTNSLPTASTLARSLAEAVRNGTIKLPIDPKSINVTDLAGVTANRSPVLASMLTAVWMTLASLLLSAVMH